jgi:hypothetical protein
MLLERARIAALLGDRDEAMTLLQQAIDRGVRRTNSTPIKKETNPPQPSRHRPTITPPSPHHPRAPPRERWSLNGIPTPNVPNTYPTAPLGT